MNLKEIIEATLIELDRGTEADTVAMYAPKFTMYANEAVTEIANRFKLMRVDPIVTDSGLAPDGYAYFNAYDLDRQCLRVINVYKGEWVAPVNPGDDPTIQLADDGFKHPLAFDETVLGMPFISVMDKSVEPDTPVFVEYRHVPQPMDASSLSNLEPDSPELPWHLHALIPLYVRAREQCGQDPSTQGTSSAYFSLFNQKVYQLQRETLATPKSFALKNYHFE